MRRRPIIVQRRGPGLLGTMARTAAIAGTATATSRVVNNMMEGRGQGQPNQSGQMAGMPPNQQGQSYSSPPPNQQNQSYSASPDQSYQTGSRQGYPSSPGQGYPAGSGQGYATPTSQPYQGGRSEQPSHPASSQASWSQTEKQARYTPATDQPSSSSPQQQPFTTRPEQQSTDPQSINKQPYATSDNQSMIQSQPYVTSDNQSMSQSQPYAAQGQPSSSQFETGQDGTGTTMGKQPGIEASLNPMAGKQEYTGKATEQPQQAGSQDKMAQLQQLTQLKQSGIITDDEFQAAKTKLFGEP